jgi:CBS domain-containing protein
MGMKVEELMTREVVTATPNTPLKDVARVLVERDISGLPVVDEGGAVLGVVSETDILHKELDQAQESSGLMSRLFGRGEHPSSTKLLARTASDAMSSPPITTSPTASVAEAATTMVAEGVDRLVVLEHENGDEGKLVGILTRGDLVRAFARDDAAIAAEIRHVIEREFWLTPSEVQFDIDEGVVTLRGRVDLKSNSEILEREIERIPGVVEVHSDLSWHLDEKEAMKSHDFGPRVE